jgi:hypothetical protein
MDKAMINEGKPSLQEWANFLILLSNKENSKSLLIKKPEPPYRLVDHLSKQLCGMQN